MKRRDDESSLSDALTPKIKETRLAGKMRTYLWVCLSTSYPHPPTWSSPCFCEKKSAWTKENGMNRCGLYYPLFSHLDALLWCLYVCSQASSSMRRRFRVALPKLLTVWKEFLELFARLQTRDISDMPPNPFTWRWQFFLLAEKNKHKISSVRVCGRGFFV